MSRARPRIVHARPRLWLWLPPLVAVSPTAWADWSYELGYRFTHLDGDAPAEVSYNADVQGVHVAFREALGGWRGELGGAYQVGSADVDAPGQTFDTSDETAWEGEYRIGPEIAPGVPWTISTEEPAMCLALKSGNFGDEDFFEKALSILP